MEKDIRMVPLPFYEEMQYFCLKNCFFQNMFCLDVPDAFLHLKVGLGLKLLIQTNDNSFTVLKHEGLMPLFEMNEIKQGCGADFLEQFEKNLSDLPVIVLADVFYLPYRQEYGKYHASHGIFLTGYDKWEKEVEIVDWYAPYFFKGKLPMEKFRQARGSDNPKDVNPFSGFSINNYWYKIEKEALEPDVEHVIRKNIMDLIGENGTRKSNMLTGREAMGKISEVMEGYLDSDSEKLKNISKKIHDELFVFYRALTLAKPYFVMAKQQHPKCVEDNVLSEIKVMSEAMEQMNFYLLKCSYSGSARTFQKAIEKMEKIKGKKDR